MAYWLICCQMMIERKNTDSSEPVFFEHVNRVYPFEITKFYVNRVDFGLLQYVKTCDDPVAINGVINLKIGYIRVSTEEQNTARQEVLLRELGVDEVFIDKASGKNADRPELTRMMNYVRRGDTVIVESISRFARNTRDLLDLVERLTEKQVEFVSRKEAIDTTTPTGKFMLTVFAAVAELEREYILQRQHEGIAIAKEQGKYTGRKPMPLPDNFERVVARWRAGEITATEAMRQTGLKPNTFYRRCSTKKPLAPQQAKPI